ncbi:MAG: sigma-70 family RNA polymerase sigma factor [Polyangiaceae bacterium]
MLNAGENETWGAKFAPLYKEHAATVRSLAWGFGVRNAVDIEDLTQDVWVTVVRKLRDFDPVKGSRRAWITEITYNAVRTWRRTRHRHPECELTAEHEGSDPSCAESLAIQAQRKAALWAYFERVVDNVQQRDAFLLHEVGGLSVHMVAEVMRSGTSVTKWRIASARRRLREGLKKGDRDKLLTVMPLVHLDAFARALSAAGPPDDSSAAARLRDRITDRVRRGASSLLVGHPRGGSPARRAASLLVPAALLAGGFLLGAVSKESLRAQAELPATSGPTAIVAEAGVRAPAPRAEVAVDPPAKPEPEPKSDPEPSQTTPAHPFSRAHTQAGLARSKERWLLDRAREVSPTDGLALLAEHERTFPDSPHAPAREEQAIYALLQLGQRDKARERAVKLLHRAPEKRRAVEALFGTLDF